MGTHYNKETGVHKGMIQLSVNYIFDRIKQISNTGDVEFIIKVSFIEIYNEDIRDLLNIKTPSKFIHIRDSPTGSGVILSGISEISVSEPDDIFK